MKWLAILTSAILALAAQATVAQTVEQEVTGEVVESRPDANELTIRVTETDDGRPERIGQTETYTVPPGTTIEVEGDEFEFPVGATRTASQDVQLDDLASGDEVIITFEESAAGRQATGLRQRAAQTGGQQQQQQTAQQDRDDGVVYADESQSRDRLPGSASPLPLLALAGAGFALVAGALRFRRRR